jgi:tellurite resistance protein TehA-like permease
LALWGYGVWWLFLAIFKTISQVLAGMPFNLGWWGLTFPLGVYSLATLALAHATHAAFFLVVGAVLVMCLAVLWVIVAARTAHGAWRGYLFVAPCLLSASVARPV